MAKALGLDSYEGARIIKVTGFLVLRKDDEASRYPLDDILQDLNDNMIDFSQIDELTLADLPNAKMTRQGVRTDVVE